MKDEPLLVEVGANGVARVTLNRPGRHNAFDDAQIARLDAAFARLEADDAARVVVLAANGASFSAGADLNWMKRTAEYSQAENLADARRLAALLNRMNGIAKPTIARVQGAAFGGGLGLVAACDVAICADDAVFALTEVRLGLVPAVVSPYLVAAIGARAARRYFLTGERFDAAEALRLGLVHQVVPRDRLDEALEALLAALAQCGPEAIAAAKDLVFSVAGKPIDEALLADTAARIASARASAEGREGVAAFLERRKPKWLEGS